MLSAGFAMPDENMAYKKRFELLSEFIKGDIITQTSPSNMALDNIGSFRFHPVKYIHGNSFIRNINFIIRAFMMALVVFIKRPYKVIICPDPLMSGLTALIVSFITRAKLIVEINGCYENSFKFDSPHAGFIVRYKDRLAHSIITFVLNHADAVRLLYPSQLNVFKKVNLARLKTFIIHEFVPVSEFLKAPIRDEGYILQIGHPWYLKGVDVLISAFLKIADDFPDVRLKVICWLPEGKEALEKITGNHPGIEICEPQPYAEIIKLMSGCTFYCLASRTEAMGRVLLEAMASSKAIVASNVGGVPYYVRDGFNGLIFKSEDVDELADKMKKLLSDSGFRQKLAASGFEYVRTELSEESYINKYLQMVKDVAN